MARHLKQHKPHRVPRRRGPDQSLPHVELEILRGRARNKRRKVAVPAFLIGTAADCDLVLGDTQYPEVYAYLMLGAKEVTLRHLGFQPELAVNGQAVTRARLLDGDRIRTGPYEFRVHIWFEEHDADEQIDKILLLRQASEDRVQQELARGEVQVLLRDIRRQLQTTAPPLRVCGDCETDIRRPGRLPSGKGGERPSAGVRTGSD